MIKTYDEVLTEVCDTFDGFITPKKIQRVDTNIVYLILKAVSKGIESVYTIVESLRSKFNPETCDDEDLLSVAKLVGTSKIIGKGSGLVINIINNNAEDPVTLEVGTYLFKYEDVIFAFEVTLGIVIPALAAAQKIAFTTVKGSYRVTSIGDIQVTREDEAPIDSDISFSCVDNASLLGYLDESNYEFRKRILNDGTRSDSISELELELRNLPSILEAKVMFNNTTVEQPIDDFVLLPFEMAIFLTGDITDEIAAIVCAKSIYATKMFDPAKYSLYTSSVFLGGQHKVYYDNFRAKEYDLAVVYDYDPRLHTPAYVESKVAEAVRPFVYNVVHTPFITEQLFYDAISDANIASLVVLDVTITVSGIPVSYISVPSSRVPKLVTFTQSKAV